MSTLARGLTHLALIDFLTTDPKTEEPDTPFFATTRSKDGDTLIDAIVHRGALSRVAHLQKLPLSVRPATAAPGKGSCRGR